MKNYLFLLLISFLFTAPSCNKDDSIPADIVQGMYVGDKQLVVDAVSDDLFENQLIMVRKLSDTKIYVEPVAPGVGASFSAELTEEDGGYRLTITSQTTASGIEFTGTGAYLNGRLNYILQKKGYNYKGYELFDGKNQ